MPAPISPTSCSPCRSRWSLIRKNSAIPILKTQRIGEAASVVAAIPGVREALVNFQRQFAADPPGAVLDGRDIGTVICPHADVKIFVVADPQVRARRRTLEARARGEDGGRGRGAGRYSQAR